MVRQNRANFFGSALKKPDNNGSFFQHVDEKEDKPSAQ
jgi:hypothetical protein